LHMISNNFLLILWCLHFTTNPNPTEPIPDDWLVKIRTLLDLRFQVLTVKSIKMADGDSKHLWNIDKLLLDYTVQQPRRQPSLLHLFNNTINSVY
jgi:hypothetical protein